MSLSEKSKALKGVAVAEARRLGHRYVGTEHLLLAVCLADDTRVRNALLSLDLDPDDLRSQVDAFLISSTKLESNEVIPVSPRALKALENAALEAEEAEPEHVLLALMQDGEGVASRVLEVFGIDYASIRTALRGSG
jgi:ATP-dependent Clp protease ATP-binding subunit ClpC